KSTDFEVHRNWLAITHSLPLSEWYFEKTSEWTLDYPPFFAWFEFFLSNIAAYFDKKMLVLSNLNYSSDATVLFQRLSVIVTDLVFIYAVKEFCGRKKSEVRLSKKLPSEDAIFTSPRLVLAIILMCNAGLLIVDHILFYNGFLFGILLLSITRMYQERYLSGAFWFAVLLNLKHIYLYIAPAYIVYLLRCYCFQHTPDNRLNWRTFSILNLIKLGMLVITVFAASFGPFIYMNQLPQVLSRLFPFKRGLCHAYWAPNFWALYNLADKVLTLTGSKFKFVSVKSSAIMTGGLVQEYQHVVLPSVPPIVTLIATVTSIMPAMLQIWLYPRGPQSFVRGIVLCAFGSFMFGWHVHEKAILLVIIPLSLLIADSKRDAGLFAFFSTVGHYSLFPLLFTQAETMTKTCLVVLFFMYVLFSFAHIYQQPLHISFLSTIEALYIWGIVPLELYNSIFHSVLGHGDKFPFLPLMLTSVYCAVGVTYSWLKFYWITFTQSDTDKEKKVQ
ncbi:hypothetical protein FSP39_023751, partial [Pinctada imbricata]